jgi:hypothetical protein
MSEIAHRLCLGDAHRAHLGDVGAGDERLVARPGEHDGAHAPLPMQRVERLDQAVQDVAVEGVELVGAVDRDGGDRALAGAQDDGIGGAHAPGRVARACRRREGMMRDTTRAQRGR